MRNQIEETNLFRSIMRPGLLIVLIFGLIIKIFNISLSQNAMSIYITLFGLFSWMFMTDMVASLLTDDEVSKQFRGFIATTGTLYGAFFALMWISYFIPQEMKPGLLPYSITASIVISVLATIFIYSCYKQK